MHTRPSEPLAQLARAVVALQSGAERLTDALVSIRLETYEGWAQLSDLLPEVKELTDRAKPLAREFCTQWIRRHDALAEEALLAIDQFSNETRPLNPRPVKAARSSGPSDEVLECNESGVDAPRPVSAAHGFEPNLGEGLLGDESE